MTAVPEEKNQNKRQRVVCAQTCVFTPTARLSPELQVCKLHVLIHKPETLLSNPK